MRLCSHSFSELSTENAREDVKIMTTESDVKRTEVAKKSQECDLLILNAEKESKEVAIKQK